MESRLEGFDAAFTALTEIQSSLFNTQQKYTSLKNMKIADQQNLKMDRGTIKYSKIAKTKHTPSNKNSHR